MEAAKVSKPDVSAVYAVDLSQRPVPQGNAAREKAALLQLARRMHDAPGEMLPRFVELAMELTGGISAGISLLEETEPSPVFRWHHLKGVLSPQRGDYAPRFLAMWYHARPKRTDTDHSSRTRLCSDTTGLVAAGSFPCISDERNHSGHCGSSPTELDISTAATGPRCRSLRVSSA